MKNQIENINYGNEQIKITPGYKQDFQKFKEYAKSKGKTPEKLLSEIQNKLIKEGKIKASEKGYFGPKMAEYMKEVYKQEEINKLKNFAEENSNGKEIQKMNQRELNKVNKNTFKSIKKVIKNTREGILGIHGNINISYLNPKKENIGKLKETSIQGYVVTDKQPGYLPTKNVYINYGNSNIYINYDNFFDKDGNKIDIKNNYTKQLEEQLDKYKGTGKTPIEALGEIYKNASEQEKIQMAQVLGAYMLDHYDYEMNKAKSMKDLRDIPDKNMWLTYKKGGLAGVCRHMHSEVAKFLEKAGITAGVISTNTGERHVITVGKLKNGKYFFIDYGDYYEGKNLMDLKNYYLDSNGQIDFKEYIGRADGKIVKIIQTALEKEFEKTTSSTGTGNIMILSKYIATNGGKIKKGGNVDININNNSKSVNISYGKDTKYGKYEIGTFYKNTKGLGFANYTSTGAYLNASWGDRYDYYGKLGAGIKYSKNHFDWSPFGTKKDLNVLSVNVNYSKNLVNTDKDKVYIGGATELGIEWGPNTTKKYDNFDGYLEGAMTLYLQHKINKNWLTYLSGTVGFDVGFKNMRDNTIGGLTAFGKYGFGGGLIYNDEDFFANLNLLYEKGLGYNKYRLGTEIKKGNIGVKGEYTKEKDTSFLHLPDKTTIKVKGAYKVSDALTTYISYKYENNYGNKNKKIEAGFNYKF